MEYPFLGTQKGNANLSLPRTGMEVIAPVDNGVNLEDSFSNVEELMNLDTYAGWYDNPNNFGEQMFPLSTNFVPFDGMNFTDQCISSISMVDGDISGSSFITGDKLTFHQIDNRPPFQSNSSDNWNVIPRPIVQSLDEKMLRALRLFREWSGGGILAQVWVPIKNGDQYILSTWEQPYLLDQTLSGYREVSRSFTFAVESKPGSLSGLPGRVFTSKIPEWTSDVMYYKEAEYLRAQYAADHKVRGSIAVPVFFEDDSLERCCAVLELVTMKEKSNFDLEMENVCRALKTVNLRSTVPPRLHPQSISKNQREALSEITDVLRAVCHAHRLPLALTWIPCNYINKSPNETIRGCNKGINGNTVLQMEGTACYVNDKDMHGFVHACAGHYLEQGQGIVGKALQSNHPFFYPDVKEYHINEYPLVHHARKFGLNAAVAIRLRSTYTGEDDYILEFFLPVSMKGSTEQQLLLNNLSGTMQRICKSLRTVSEEEFLGAEDSTIKLLDGEVKNVRMGLSRRSSEHSFVKGDLNCVDPMGRNILETANKGIEGDGGHEQKIVGSKKHVEKKRSTAEKHVSLSVLQQYFSGSLKDAAKEIGVCPTTLKRICRQHGISRWPSRKINKVNRSLRKIQSVIDSVQGVEGGLKFDPTTGGLVSTGSIIQESDPNKTIVSPNKNPSIKISDAPPSPYMDIETTIGILEKECLFGGNQFPGQNSIGTNYYLSESHEESKLVVLDAGNSLPASLNAVPWTTSPNAPQTSFMKPEASEFQPTSSGMTDSSNGSMTSGGSSSLSEKQLAKTEVTHGETGSKITVKATYKEDMVRFKFDPSSGCFKLYEEVAKRFPLQTGQFQMKYFDDEEEWVMLVSDSDLQECLEIMDFVGTRNVKFLVRDVPSSIGSSGSSNCFMGGGS